MTAMAVVLAQVDPTLADPASWKDFVGPFAIVVVAMLVMGGGVVAYLLREIAKSSKRHDAELAALKTEHAAALDTAKKGYEDDVAAHRHQLDLERQENRALADRLVASAERTAPILERAAIALEHAAGANR